MSFFEWIFYSIGSVFLIYLFVRIGTAAYFKSKKDYERTN